MTSKKRDGGCKHDISTAYFQYLVSQKKYPLSDCPIIGFILWRTIF